MKNKEYLKTLSDKTLADLLKIQKEKEKEIQDLYCKNPEQKEKDLHHRRKLRYQLAQIKTIISQKAVQGLKE